MINKSGWGKGGKGIECKCMIAFLVQSIISYLENVLLGSDNLTDENNLAVFRNV
jgi:hypothetical protein